MQPPKIGVLLCNRLGFLIRIIAVPPNGIQVMIIAASRFCHSPIVKCRCAPHRWPEKRPNQSERELRSFEVSHEITSTFQWSAISGDTRYQRRDNYTPPSICSEKNKGSNTYNNLRDREHNHCIWGIFRRLSRTVLPKVRGQIWLPFLTCRGRWM